MKTLKLFICIMLLAFASHTTAQKLEFAVNPYLQNPAENSMTVMWRVEKPSYGWVEYGLTSNNLQKARTVEDGIVAANIKHNKVRIDGLKSGQKYYYRIASCEVLDYKSYNKAFGDTLYSEIHSFTTLDDYKQNFTAVIFNDTHSRLPLFNKLHSLIKDVNYDLVVFNGDCFQYPQSEENEVKILAEYCKVLRAAEIPIIFLRGNHETRGEYALEWPKLFDRQNNKPYSAFNLGDTKFILLDNGEDKVDSTPVYADLVDFDEFRRTQTSWLTEQIKDKSFKKASARILIQHQPLYGQDSKYNKGFIPCFDLWNPIFQKTNFDIAISGHTHKYAYHPKGTANNSKFMTSLIECPSRFVN